MANRKNYGTTKRGFKVTNIFKGRDGRLYGVIERPKGVFTDTDYIVGAGFDKRDNSWAQGYYDFPTKQKAINYAKKRAYKK